MKKIVKDSAKDDRRRWLDVLVANGDWQSLKMLRKPRQATKGRLRDMVGEVVAHDEKAEMLAQYFSRVQWQVRLVGALPDDAVLGEELPILVSSILPSEIQAASRSLKSGKAFGTDGIPAEYWKILLEDKQHPIFSWILEFCNTIWHHQEVPAQWHESRVIALFKKGDMGSCGNYRPISLINNGYKLLASIILTRMKTGGADDRIWGTQFGFRKGRGTADAILLARRLLEQANQRKDGKICMVALDWAKAFDSISPDRLLFSLRRFGIPEHMVGVIGAIYDNRKFFVKMGEHESRWYDQAFGIVQGCPLSPFLFSIAMTCLLADADKDITEKYGQIFASISLTRSLLYVDDIFIIEGSLDVA